MAEQLYSAFSSTNDVNTHHAYIKEAFTRYAEVASSKQLSIQAAHHKEQLANVSQENTRLQHDKNILKKGVKSVLKKQSEWVKVKERLNDVEKEKIELEQ